MAVNEVLGFPPRLEDAGLEDCAQTARQHELSTVVTNIGGVRVVQEECVKGPGQGKACEETFAYQNGSVVLGEDKSCVASRAGGLVEEGPDLIVEPDVGLVPRSGRQETDRSEMYSSSAVAITPVSELFTSSFLNRYDDTLLSYTIWDHAEEEVYAKTGWERATSVEDLLSTFEFILAAKVMKDIRRTVIALKTSQLGQATLLVPTKVNIFRNILQGLKRCAYEENEKEYSEGWKEVVGRRKKKQGAESGGERRIGSGSQDQSGAEGGDKDDDNYLMKSSEEYFWGVNQVFVNLGIFKTPPRGDQKLRGSKISERGLSFCGHPVVAASHVPFFGQKEGRGCLYHGTRLTSLSSFYSMGIHPYKSFTEFSPNPSFYLTNDIQTSYEFPFYNHIAASSNDPVVVFRFELDLMILNGQGVTSCGHRFRVRHFQQCDISDWTEFCERNLYSRIQKQHTFDIVIGPMCYPSKELKKVQNRSLELIQVALCTERAWKWVSACLRKNFIERRGEGEHQLTE